MTITYTFPLDCPLPQLRGVTCTGGKVTSMKIDGKMVEAVAFTSPLVGGQTVTARIDNKPDLQAIIAADKERSAQAVAAKQAALEASVQGLAAYESAMRTYSNAADAYDRASEHGYPAKESAAADAAEKALQAVHAKYPATVAWRKIEEFCQAHNDAKSSAGYTARRAVESGIDVFSAAEKMETEWKEAAERAVWNS